MNITQFFQSACKILLIFPLYWTKNLGLGSLLLRLLTFLRCRSFWGGFAVTFSFMTIFSNVSLTILEDHSVGYWISVEIFLFFLRATSMDFQSLVALKILCTVPWNTFLLCCNGAQLRKFKIMPVSIDFYFNDSWFFYLRLGLCLDLGMPGLHFRLVSQEWIVSSCEENLHTQGNLEGSSLPCTLCHPHTSWIVSTPVCPLFYLFLHNRNRSKQFPAWSIFCVSVTLAFCMKPVFAWFALDSFPSESNASVTVNAYHLCVRSFDLPSLFWFLQRFFKGFHPQICQNYRQRSTHC